MGIMRALGLKKEEYIHKIKAEWSEWDAKVERERAERKRNKAGEELGYDEDLQTGVEKAWLDVKNVFHKIGNRIH